MAPKGPRVTFRRGGGAGPLLIDLLLCANTNEERSLPRGLRQRTTMAPVECEPVSKALIHVIMQLIRCAQLSKTHISATKTDRKQAVMRHE